MNAVERRKDRRRHEKLLAEIKRLKEWNKELTVRIEEYERRDVENDVPLWKKVFT